MKLSDEQKRFFIREGYVILPRFVDDEYVTAATSFIHAHIAAGEQNLKDTSNGSADPAISFGHAAKRAVPITDLVFKTGLLDLAEDLLGDGNATVRDNVGQIAYVEPRKDGIRDGTDINEPPAKHRWHVDSGHGKYAALGSDFSILMGVALSDGQQVDESRGQFVLFPKSHFITHPALTEAIKKNPVGNATSEFLKKRSVDIGEPMRACLSPGDALICHQRVAHVPGFNFWNKPRINIYFRIVHAMIDDILDDQVLSPTPWVGFEGLRPLLPDGAVDYKDHSLPQQLVELKLPKFAKDRDVTHPRQLSEHDLVITEEQKQAFIKDGYVVLPGAVSSDLVQTALSFTDQAYDEDKYNMNGAAKIGSKDPFPSFHKPLQRSEQVLGLFYKSGLYGVSEQLLGEDNIGLREQQGEVIYNRPCEIFLEEGKDVSQPLPKGRWNLDHARGKYKGTASDFMLRIGVCLSEGQEADESRGQQNVWPGSHLTTHPAVSEVIESAPPGGIMRLLKSKKLKLGGPKRVLLRPGDVVVGHQRLAKAEGLNLSDTVSKIVYFRVLHAHRDELLDNYVKSPRPWMGFDGLKGLLPAEAVHWGAKAEKKTNALSRLLNAPTVAKSRGSLRLSNDQLVTFVRDGYVIIPGAVSTDLVEEALDYSDNAFQSKRVDLKGEDVLGSEKQSPIFKKMIRRSSEVKRLFYQSGLMEASEQIMGGGNVMVRDAMARISYIHQSEISVKEGMSMTQPFPKRKWKVLSHKAIKANGGGGDHNFIVGVAISEDQDIDENRGQLVVWPGSHVISHKALREIVVQGDESTNVPQRFRKTVLELGEPVRVLLKAGDAVITHQRLAKAQGINLSESVSKTVYFSIHHDSFDERVPEFIRSELPFYGYDGIQEIAAEVFQ